MRKSVAIVAVLACAVVTSPVPAWARPATSSRASVVVAGQTISDPLMKAWWTAKRHGQVTRLHVQGRTLAGVSTEVTAHWRSSRIRLPKATSTMGLFAFSFDDVHDSVLIGTSPSASRVTIRIRLSGHRGWSDALVVSHPYPGSIELQRAQAYFS